MWEVSVVAEVSDTYAWMILNGRRGRGSTPKADRVISIAEALIAERMKAPTTP